MWLESFFHYLCGELVSSSRIGYRIKRESGVNPGQSRCCEAPFNILINTFATDLDGREGFRRGVSQKTCHSLMLFLLVG